jgi:hypothetical protein
MDEDTVELMLRNIIIDVCEVLHRHGYTSVCVGAVMRLIGVAEEQASNHDNEFFDLDQDFQSTLKQHQSREVNPEVPPGTTIH